MLEKKENGKAIPASEKAVEAEDLVIALKRLPEAERVKILYMIKGIELMSENLAGVAV